ncbi:MAG: hypothetical protein V2A62_03065 [Candidatus Woesearchaeota archaeon]
MKITIIKSWKLMLVLLLILLLSSSAALALKINVKCPTSASVGSAVDCTLEADSSLVAPFGVQFKINAPGFIAGTPFFAGNSPIGDVPNVGLDKDIALLALSPPNLKLATIKLIAGNVAGSYVISIQNLAGKSGTTVLGGGDTTSATITVTTGCIPKECVYQDYAGGIKDCGIKDDGCGGTINCNFQKYTGGLECPNGLACKNNACVPSGGDGEETTDDEQGLFDKITEYLAALRAQVITEKGADATPTVMQKLTAIARAIKESNPFHQNT